MFRRVKSLKVFLECESGFAFTILSASGMVAMRSSAYWKGTLPDLRRVQSVFDGLVF